MPLILFMVVVKTNCGDYSRKKIICQQHLFFVQIKPQKRSCHHLSTYFSTTEYPNFIKRFFDDLSNISSYI